VWDPRRSVVESYVRLSSQIRLLTTLACLWLGIRWRGGYRVWDPRRSVVVDRVQVMFSFCPAEVFRTVTYVWNRMSTSALEGRTPYEVVYSVERTLQTCAHLACLAPLTS